MMAYMGDAPHRIHGDETCVYVGISTVIPVILLISSYFNNVQTSFFLSNSSQFLQKKYR